MMKGSLNRWVKIHFNHRPYTHVATIVEPLILTALKARRHANMLTLISTSVSMSKFRHSLFYSTYRPDMEGKGM